MHNLTEWVRIREDRNPHVGQSIRKVPELAVDHGDGSGHAERLEELGECIGTITQIGAHWSTAGASGWWCLVEYDTPDYSRFCEHYGYKVGSGESLREYAAYAENRAMLDGVVAADTTDHIATEFRRVFGSPATAELHGAYVLVNVEAWPERALYRGAAALETLSRYADSYGASVEGDSEVCAALEASGAFVSLETDHNNSVAATVRRLAALQSRLHTHGALSQQEQSERATYLHILEDQAPEAALIVERWIAAGRDAVLRLEDDDLVLYSGVPDEDGLQPAARWTVDETTWSAIQPIVEG